MSLNPNCDTVSVTPLLPKSSELSLASGLGTVHYYLTRCWRDVLETAPSGGGSFPAAGSGSEIVSGLLNAEENTEAAKCLREVLLEIDLTEDRPWRKERGLGDFFNYDLTERTFREFIRTQIRYSETCYVNYEPFEKCEPLISLLLCITPQTSF